MGVGDGQWGLTCCSPWGHRFGKGWATELNWTDRLYSYFATFLNTVFFFSISRSNLEEDIIALGHQVSLVFSNVYSFSVFLSVFVNQQILPRYYIVCISICVHLICFHVCWSDIIYGIIPQKWGASYTSSHQQGCDISMTYYWWY